MCAERIDQAVVVPIQEGLEGIRREAGLVIGQEGAAHPLYHRTGIREGMPVDLQADMGGLGAKLEKGFGVPLG